jgi:hypothetical protein
VHHPLKIQKRLPFLWLIPSNLLGFSFFVIELLSLRKEGVFPLPNIAVQGTLRDEAAQRP